MRRLLLPVFLCAMGLGVIPHGVEAASPAPTAKYVAMIVLDAGRPDYITNHINQMPTMKAFLQHSRWYDRAWVGDLMSITPPGHAVIGTGSLPKNDGGIVNWDWGIHSTGTISPTMQALQSYQNGWAFKLIKDSGTPTLAGVIHSKYPKGLVIAGSGAHFHAAGPLGGPDANFIFSYDRINGNWAPYSLSPGHPVPTGLLQDPTLRTPLATNNGTSVPLVYDPVKLGTQDSLVVSFAIKALQQYKPRGILINLPEIDTVGHWSQKWRKDEGTLYRSFDSDFARLIAAYKAAGIYDQTMFVVTADHGMIQSKHRVVDREAIIGKIRSLLGQKSIILTNGGGTGGPTMTSFWLRDQANNKRAAKAIFTQHYDNVSAIYYLVHKNGRYAYQQAGCEQCTPQLQATYGYLLSTEAGPTGEDVAVLMRENSRNSGLPSMVGRHGGADWGSQHITLLMSGPGMQPGISQAPARLADIAPTIEREMGITPDARDGVVLADAFQQPLASDVTKQGTLNTTLNPMVTALAARAKSDVKLEANGTLANFIPSDEIIIHWKRRWAVTIAGIVALIITAGVLVWAIKEVRRQGTGLQWTA